MMSNYAWFGLIGLSIGLLASTLRQGGAFSIIGDITVGTLGALMGGFLFRFVSADGEALLGSLVAAVIGAGLMVLDLWLIQRSYVERLFRRPVWHRGSHSSKCERLMPRLPGEERRLCQVCGQKHLL